MEARRPWLVCCLLLVSCGRVGFDDVNVGSDGPPGDATSDGTPLSCPAMYLSVPNQTSKYRVVLSSGREWLTAEQACEADGAHLWIPDSSNEKSDVLALAPGENLWTGITDRIALGQFVRVTGGAQTYLPWEPTEPDIDTLQRCIQIDSQLGLFGDHECVDLREYICECDGAPVVAGTY